MNSSDIINIWTVLACMLMLIEMCQVSGGPLSPANEVNTLKVRTINGIKVTCYTIQCNENQYPKFCTEDFGHDTCHKCPLGYINKVPINSVEWEYELPAKGGFCTKLDCTCPPESIAVDDTCFTTGIKKCVCDLADNQYGHDFQKCSYFEGICLAGTELTHEGHCIECKDGYFKSHDGKGLCIPHNVCHPPHQEVDFHGNKTSDVTCRPALKNTSSTLIYGENVTPSHVPVSPYITDNPVKANDSSTNSSNTEPKKGAEENGTKTNDDNKTVMIILIIVIIALVAIPVLVICCKKRLEDQAELSEWSSRLCNLYTSLRNCSWRNISERKSTQQQSVMYDPVESQTSLTKQNDQESTTYNPHGSQTFVKGQCGESAEQDSILCPNKHKSNSHLSYKEKPVKDADAQASLQSSEPVEDDENIDPYKTLANNPLSSMNDQQKEKIDESQEEDKFESFKSKPPNMDEDTENKVVGERTEMFEFRNDDSPTFSSKDDAETGPALGGIPNKRKVQKVSPYSQDRNTSDRSKQVSNNGASARMLVSTSTAVTSRLPPVTQTHPESLMLPSAEPLQVDSIYDQEEAEDDN